MIDWEKFISIENIYRAWHDFSAGKKQKNDVIAFKMNLEEEIYSLHLDLKNGNYHHGTYTTFKVYDPKERIINKATVRDRVLHRLLYNEFLPVFNRVWLDCSFSCRPEFGQHKSIAKVWRVIRQVTGNYSKEFWAVKCDIKKFFNNIDHKILFRLLCRKIYDERMRELLREVLNSFYYGCPGKGIPIGNLTSQIFGNVYMHELDWFAKHELKLRQYYRYADDFIFLAKSESEARLIIEQLQFFLADTLALEMHPGKIIQRHAQWGVDWLGKVLLPDYVLLRPSTRRRMVKKIKEKVLAGVEKEELFGMIASYNGLLKGTARKKVNREILQAVAFCR